MELMNTRSPTPSPRGPSPAFGGPSPDGASSRSGSFGGPSPTPVAQTMHRAGPSVLAHIPGDANGGDPSSSSSSSSDDGGPPIDVATLPRPRARKRGGGFLTTHDSVGKMMTALASPSASPTNANAAAGGAGDSKPGRASLEDAPSRALRAAQAAAALMAGKRYIACVWAPSVGWRRVHGNTSHLWAVCGCVLAGGRARCLRHRSAASMPSCTTATTSPGGGTGGRPWCSFARWASSACQ